ncbi:hypothetical protein LCGC14_2721460, partial [marine sediment metagenome]
MSVLYKRIHELESELALSLAHNLAVDKTGNAKATKITITELYNILVLINADEYTVNTSGTVTEARDEKISSSSVTRWGKRTVDEGKFQFNINTKIDENYNVKY